MDSKMSTGARRVLRPPKSGAPHFRRGGASSHIRHLLPRRLFCFIAAKIATQKHEGVKIATADIKCCLVRNLICKSGFWNALFSHFRIVLKMQKRK